MTKIEDSLGIVPIKDTISGEIVETPKEEPKDLDSEKDHKFARDNMIEVITRGGEALDEMLEIAKSSEHPRAFEVVSTIMKTLVDANKDLVKLSELRNKNKEPEGKQTNNTAVFVGSTTEFQKMLKDLKNNG